MMISPTTTFIQCQCGPYHLALPMPQVLRIERDLAVTLDDKSDTPFGWITIEEKKVPLLDLGFCLGEPAHDLQKAAQFILLRHHDKTLALLVDRVVRARPPHTVTLKPLGPAVFNMTQGLFSGIAAEDPPLFLIDFKGLASLAGLSPLPLAASNRDLDPSRPLARDSTSPLLSFSFAVPPELHSTRWGLSVAQVEEIRQPEPLIHLAKSPDFFLGLLWWREEPVPIIDLNLRQGWLDSDRAERLLIARVPHGDHHVGFLCHSDIRMERDLTGYQPVPIITQKHGILAKGVYQKDDNTLVVPDLEAILA